jgi:hypothetical protein
MHKTVKMVGLYAALAAASAAAQTVAGSGTPNYIPMFSGSTSPSTTLTNSAITESNGNVGIGTTTPDSLLEVGNPSIGNSFHSAVGGGYAGLFENVYTGYGAGGILLWVKSVNQNPGSYHFFVQGNNNPELVVQGNGNIGIGTSSPNAPLNIASGSVYAGSQIYNALTVQPYGGSAYGANGSSILLSSVTNYVSPVTNSNIQPIAGVWSSLDTGGNGAVNYGGSLVLGSTSPGNSTPVEQMRINSLGYIGIGTTTPAAKLEVNGNVKLTSGSGASITFADATIQSTAWTGTLCGGDYAETMDVSGERKSYEPGDVLMLDPNTPGNVLRVTEPYSTLVAGIYSMKPGVVGRRQIIDPKDSTTEVPMAMVGVVPTKVSAENGSIKIGDLLVTSSTPGHAMKGTDRTRLIGAIVGKAMGNLESGTGVIEVLVSLQ